MPQVYSISLRRYEKPRFPKRCVICGQDHPDEKVGVSDFAVSWFSFLSDIPDDWASVQVPIHYRCKWRFRARRWGTRLVYLVLAGLICWQTLPWIKLQMQGRLPRIAEKIVIAVLLIPVAFLEVIFPPAFDVTFFEESVEFDFLDPVYCQDFRERNAERLVR